LADAVPLEVDAEGRELDGGLELGGRAVLDGELGLVLVVDLGSGVEGGPANNNPLFRLVVALLPGLAVVAQLDLPLLALLLVDGDSRGAGLEEGDGDGQADGFAVVVDGL